MLTREYVEQFEPEVGFGPPPRHQDLVARMRDRCPSLWSTAPPALREKSTVRP